MSRRQTRRIKPRAPTQARLTYQRLFTRMRKDLEQLLKEQLYPVLPALLAQDREERGIRTDTAVDELVRIFGGMAVIFGSVYSDEQIAAELLAIGGLTAANARKENGRQLLGVGITPVVNNNFTPQLLSAFVKENVGLVRSVGADQLPALERVVTSGFRRGIRVEEIRKEIQSKFQVSRSRAALWAKDQVFKLQGEFSRVEQTNAGIRGYFWRTVKDGRVRDSHKQLEGSKQSWSRPPVVAKDGRRAHPGGDYQCRCYPEPDINTLVLDETPTELQQFAPAASATSLALQAGLAFSSVVLGKNI